MSDRATMPSSYDEDIAREPDSGGPLDGEHGSAPIFRIADNCQHAEPGDEDSEAWSEWADDHPESWDADERICLLNRIGWFCPACTDAAREDEDLPADEYVTCRISTEGEQ